MVFEVVKKCSGLTEPVRVVRQMVQVHTFTNYASEIHLTVFDLILEVISPLKTFQQIFYVISRVVVYGTANQPKVLAARRVYRVVITANTILNRMGTH